MLFRFWVFPDCTFLDISIPPLEPPEKGKGSYPLTPHIGSFYLEELHALRNQVQCTWLRHEPLRFVTTLNRALLS